MPLLLHLGAFTSKPVYSINKNCELAMKFKRIIFATFFIFLALIFQGCGNAAQSQEVEQKMVDKFHQQLSQKKYAEIYRDSNDTLKNSISEEDFVKFISEAHEKMGSFKKYKLLNVIKKSALLGKGRPTVFMTYKSNYSNYLVEELFIFEQNNSKMEFAGYKYTLFERGNED